MEGGLLNWRVQKHDLKDFPKIEEYLKSLPNPPEGYSWKHLDDNTWILLKSNLKNDDHTISIQEPARSTESVVINHVIMPSDTIQGICLKYRTSAGELRRINMFSGNNIKSFKILKIPIEPNVPFTSQLETQEYILQKFKNETNENTIEAKIYLEGSSWDFENAMSSWREDDKFSKRHNNEMMIQFSSLSNNNVDEEMISIATTKSKSKQSSEIELTELSPLLE